MFKFKFKFKSTGKGKPVACGPGAVSHSSAFLRNRNNVKQCIQTLVCFTKNKMKKKGLGSEKPGEDVQTDVQMDGHGDKQKDIRNFTLVSYRTSGLLDCYPCPAFGQLH